MLRFVEIGRVLSQVGTPDETVLTSFFFFFCEASGDFPRQSTSFCRHAWQGLQRTAAVSRSARCGRVGPPSRAMDCVGQLALVPPRTSRGLRVFFLSCRNAVVRVASLIIPLQLFPPSPGSSRWLRASGVTYTRALLRNHASRPSTGEVLRRRVRRPPPPALFASSSRLEKRLLTSGMCRTGGRFSPFRQFPWRLRKSVFGAKA